MFIYIYIYIIYALRASRRGHWRLRGQRRGPWGSMMGATASSGGSWGDFALLKTQTMKAHHKICGFTMLKSQNTLMY